MRGLLGLLICGMLAACGGSGGGGGGKPADPAPPAGDATSIRPTPVTPAVSGAANGPAGAGQPIAIRQPQASSPIAFDHQPVPRVWVVNPDQDSVSVLDATTQAVIKEIPVGTAPRTVDHNQRMGIGRNPMRQIQHIAHPVFAPDKALV